MTPIHLVFALAVFNFATTQAARVLLALYALQFGAQPFAVGALSATFSAFPMLGAWMAGRVVDRLGSRRPLVFGAVMSGCGMLVPYLMPGLPALYVGAAMNGLSFTFYTVSLQNLVGVLGKESERAKEYSNYAMVVSFATFLGPLIAGFSIDHLGFRIACLIVAVLGFMPLGMLWAFGRLLPGGAPAHGRSENIGDIFMDPNVRRVLATSSLVVWGTDQFQFYLPIYGHAIGLSASSIGIVLAMFALAAVVVRVVIPRLVSRYAVETVLSYAFYIAAACYVVMPLFQAAWLLAAIAFLFGLGLGVGAPITLMLTYSQSPPGRSGEALGLRMTANHMARVVGPLVFGTVGSAFGLFPVFWGNAVLMGSGGLLSGRAATDPKPRQSDTV